MPAAWPAPSCGGTFWGVDGVRRCVQHGTKDAGISAAKGGLGSVAWRREPRTQVTLKGNWGTGVDARLSPETPLYLPNFEPMGIYYLLSIYVSIYTVTPLMDPAPGSVPPHI